MILKEKIQTIVNKLLIDLYTAQLDSSFYLDKQIKSDENNYIIYNFQRIDESLTSTDFLIEELEIFAVETAVLGAATLGVGVGTKIITMPFKVISILKKFALIEQLGKIISTTKKVALVSIPATYLAAEYFYNKNYFQFVEVLDQESYYRKCGFEILEES